MSQRHLTSISISCYHKTNVGTRLLLKEVPLSCQLPIIAEVGANATNHTLALHSKKSRKNHGHDFINIVGVNFSAVGAISLISTKS